MQPGGHRPPAGTLRDLDQHATWLRAVCAAASAGGYPLVVNARVDNFLGPFIADAPPGHQLALVPDALLRANAYLDAGADCVYPVALWEPDAVDRFMSEVQGPVNLTVEPHSPPLPELAALGVARLSWAIYLHVESMAHFEGQLACILAVSADRGLSYVGDRRRREGAPVGCAS